MQCLWSTRKFSLNVTDEDEDEDDERDWVSRHHCFT